MEVENQSGKIFHPLHCELNLLSRSDGSAMFCQGSNTVLASVYGPIEVKAQKMLIEKATVETHFRHKSGMTGVSDRMCESVIRNTCETALLAALHPRTSILVLIQEMEDSGGLLACAINAACLALIHSGLSMKFLFAAVTCVIGTDGTIVINPSEDDINDAEAVFTFTFDSIDKSVIGSHTTGKFTTTQYFNAQEQCKEASNDVFTFYRNIVTKYCL